MLMLTRIEAEILMHRLKKLSARDIQLQEKKTDKVTAHILKCNLYGYNLSFSFPVNEKQISVLIYLPGYDLRFGIIDFPWNRLKLLNKSVFDILFNMQKKRLGL